MPGLGIDKDASNLAGTLAISALPHGLHDKQLNYNCCHYKHDDSAFPSLAPLAKRNGQWADASDGDYEEWQTAQKNDKEDVPA
eukprot:8090147-Karenia_brevis.AAC.1